MVQKERTLKYLTGGADYGGTKEKQEQTNRSATEGLTKEQEQRNRLTTEQHIKPAGVNKQFSPSRQGEWTRGHDNTIRTNRPEHYRGPS